jgi:hypothetical protein
MEVKIKGLSGSLATLLHQQPEMTASDHTRYWRQQLATVANSEKRGPLQQISRLMKSIAFLITAAWRSRHSGARWVLV